MNDDVMQQIFEFAWVEERIQMRRAFGEIFRYPQIDVKSVGFRIMRSDVSQISDGFHYAMVLGPYRIEKSFCYFGGHERMETFIGENGLYANKSMGSLCFTLWFVRSACNKPRSRGFG
jgi:hypothetical protein